MELVKYTEGTKDLQIVDQGTIKILTLADGTAVPLMSKVPFWVQFVQPGTVKNNKALKGKKGMFYFPAYAADDEDGEEEEAPDEADLFSTELRVLYIGLFGIQRALMPPYEPGGDSEPICASDDGVWPRASIEVPRADKCGTWVMEEGKAPFLKDICPVGSWVNGNKPECQRRFAHLFFDMDRKAPIMLPLHGTSIGPFRKLQKKAQLLQLKAVTKGLDLDKYFIKISPGADEGTYIKMSFNFAQADDIDPALFLPAVAWYQENLLPTLGEDPERPKRAEDDMEGSGEIPEEELENMKKEQEDAAQEDFSLDVD